MIRRWFRVCCWIVLVLSAGLWVVSEIGSAHLLCDSGPTRITIVLSRGTFDIACWSADRVTTIRPLGALPSLCDPEVYWVSHRNAHRNDRDRVWLPTIGFLSWIEANLSVPLWALVVGSILGLIFTRRRRVRQGLCPKCGYDISLSTLPVCPECGAGIKRAGRGSEEKGPPKGRNEKGES